MGETMELGDLLRQEHVDLSVLDPAPAEPTMREHTLRIRRPQPWLCAVCGERGSASRLYDSPEHGPR
jgi:hypothetical protein